MSPGPVKPGLALELELEQKWMEEVTKVPGNLRGVLKILPGLVVKHPEDASTDVGSSDEATD